MTKTLQQIVDANPDAETFRFGDNPKLCADIIALVRAGKKTATCEAASAYGAGGDAYPEVGRRDIALNWDGTPAFMIETVEVSTRRFSEMDAEFVAAQGEFRDLNDWRASAIEIRLVTCAFKPDMKLMCERFTLIEDYA